jgi:hypothetical protein
MEYSLAPTSTAAAVQPTAAGPRAIAQAAKFYIITTYPGRGSEGNLLATSQARIRWRDMGLAMATPARAANTATNETCIVSKWHGTEVEGEKKDDSESAKGERQARKEW